MKLTMDDCLDDIPEFASLKSLLVDEFFNLPPSFVTHFSDWNLNQWLEASGQNPDKARIQLEKIGEVAPGLCVDRHHWGDGASPKNVSGFLLEKDIKIKYLDIEWQVWDEFQGEIDELPWKLAQHIVWASRDQERAKSAALSFRLAGFSQALAWTDELQA